MMGKFNCLFFVLSVVNRLKVELRVVLVFVLGWLILLRIIIGCRLSDKVLDKMNFVWGMGFLVVLINSKYLLIIDRICLIFLLKFVWFGVFIMFICIFCLLCVYMIDVYLVKMVILCLCLILFEFIVCFVIFEWVVIVFDWCSILFISVVLLWLICVMIVIFLRLVMLCCVNSVWWRYEFVCLEL